MKELERRKPRGMEPRGHGEKWGRPKKEGFWTGRAKEGDKREESFKGPRDQRKEPMERGKVWGNVGVLLEEEFRIPLSLSREERVIVLYYLCFGSCLVSSFPTPPPPGSVDRSSMKQFETWKCRKVLTNWHVERSSPPRMSDTLQVIELNFVYLFQLEWLFKDSCSLLAS